MFFSLRNRLFLIFTCVLTIPFIVFSLLVPRWFSSTIEDQTQDLVVGMMDQYSLYINSIALQAEDLGKQVLVNDSTQQWMKVDNKSSGISNDRRAVIRNQQKSLLSSLTANNSNDMSISVTLNDGTGTSGNNPNWYKASWYREFTEEGKPFITSHTDPLQPASSNINSYVLPLIDMNTFISYGFIKVNFPTDLLASALKKNTVGGVGNANLVNQRGENVLKGKMDTPKQVLHNSLLTINKSKFAKGLLQTNYKTDTYFVFYQKLPVMDWILLSEVKKSDLFSNAYDLRRNMLLISAFVFLLTIVASYMLSSNIVKPIGKLAKGMGFIERGDFSGAKRFMPTVKTPKNEVGYLVNVFTHTVDQLKNRIETEYEANIRRKDAEYKALLLQINPHFLNNTLEILSGLAAQGKNREVMNVSVYLGRMMRYSLNTNTDVVKMSDAIGYIRNYTNILKIRYEDSITIKIEEDPETFDFPIIKFVLQPLVENAVKYSFSEEKFATLLIKTKKLENQICIVIEDEGAGMSEEFIAKIYKEDLEQDTNNVLMSEGTSIGLRNVLGRLRLFYGENFSYKIESEIGKGTRITFSINIEEDDLHVEGTDYG
ncbi:sensor histidine kinase [Fictibacillus fluitans]|uniref:histidine kinase n=1 Tax=Fictibacillus fluitans TaxID=3058422 RepID=A0ABT8HY15_9BACL|nr:sensor histidine kinase [Fictibacillus sp. NE201]MDN4525638.1 histidine kinase [Fictibacillus sp. NE201]